MLSKQMKNQFKIWGIGVLIFYVVCFGFLIIHNFQVWTLSPFVESLIGVFMGAGAIAVITGIILIFQSSIQTQQEKNQVVFQQKIELYKKIIDQMQQAFKVQDNEEKSTITEEEKLDLFFTQLNIALLSKPKTFRSFSELINDIAEEDGSLKEGASKLLLDFIMDARNDLDVQEKMTDQDKAYFNDAIEIAKDQANRVTKLNYSVEGEKVIAECKVSLNDILHHLIKYESQKIRIEINGEEVGRGKVKPILRAIIKEYNIKTDKTGTQPMGKEVIEHFVNERSQ